ncbi:MAG: hypothetical protein HY080_17215 [Gammaproteobacteria bacterium]|nr:hypothetical protein [Gammaproteobacteria bacterium]
MNNLNLIDIEASGLHRDSYPIEIAILVNGKILSWLITPEKSWSHWDVAAEALHGISREQLSKHGQAARYVADAINGAVARTNGLLYSDAAAWDAEWINTLYDAVGALPQLHILPLSDLFSEAGYRLFEQQRDALARSGHYRRHRAVQDVKMIYAAYTAVTKTEQP